MKIAGCLPTQNYTDECQVFQTLKNMTDCVIVLDDNSYRTLPEEYVMSCDEYIRLDHYQDQTWQDFGNRITLFYRAFIRQCDWILMLDDDWILDNSLNTKEDLIKLIRKAEGYDYVVVRRRDLWENETDNLTYRSDGIWNNKESCILYKNPFLKPNISFLDPAKHRLHRRPDCLPRPTGITVAHCLYHTGFYTKEKRQYRYNTYQLQEDTNNQFQNDYSYIINDQNIELTQVPNIDAEKLKKLCKIPKGTP